MDQMYSFLHTHQAEPSILLRFLNVKAFACVPHHELNLSLYGPYGNEESVGSAILHRILQSLLGDSKQAQRDIFRQIPRYLPVGELNAFLVLFGDLAAEGSKQPPRRSLVCGVQLVRQGFIPSNFGAVFLISSALFVAATDPSYVRFARSISIDRSASRWQMSSCRSLAIRLRSFSCASIS